MEEDSNGDEPTRIDGSRERCTVCQSISNLKIPFCRTCGRIDGGVKQECTFVHRSCAEKIMNKDRKLKCPICQTKMVMSYNGAVHEEYALRNMKETFNMCFPSSRRGCLYNFLVVKHTLLALGSLFWMGLFIGLALHADNSTVLIISQVVLTLSFAFFLFSWFMASSSTLRYVILYGSIRIARQQLVSEIILYILLASLNLLGGVTWKTLIDLDGLFGAWTISVALLTLCIVIVEITSKVKIYGNLVRIGINIEVDNSPEDEMSKWNW